MSFFLPTPDWNPASDEDVEVAARSDAEFDGRTFSALSRIDRERYLARAKKAMLAVDEHRLAGFLWRHGEN